MSVFPLAPEIDRNEKPGRRKAPDPPVRNVPAPAPLPEEGEIMMNTVTHLYQRIKSKMNIVMGLHKNTCSYHPICGATVSFLKKINSKTQSWFGVLGISTGN